MKHDSDLLQRSMDAAPDEWLDRLVAERVMLEVRREGALRVTHPGVGDAARGDDAAPGERSKQAKIKLGADCQNFLKNSAMALLEKLGIEWPAPVTRHHTTG